jgi:hypothetical protein
MCDIGYKNKDCKKECGLGRFDCIYYQDRYRQRTKRFIG